MIVEKIKALGTDVETVLWQEVEFKIEECKSIFFILKDNKSSPKLMSGKEIMLLYSYFHGFII